MNRFPHYNNPPMVQMPLLPTNSPYVTLQRYHVVHYQIINCSGAGPIPGNGFFSVLRPFNPPPQSQPQQRFFPPWFVPPLVNSSQAFPGSLPAVYQGLTYNHSRQQGPDHSFASYSDESKSGSQEPSTEPSTEPFPLESVPEKRMGRNQKQYPDESFPPLNSVSAGSQEPPTRASSGRKKKRNSRRNQQQCPDESFPSLNSEHEPSTSSSAVLKEKRNLAMNNQQQQGLDESFTSLKEQEPSTSSSTVLKPKKNSTKNNQQGPDDLIPPLNSELSAGSQEPSTDRKKKGNSETNQPKGPDVSFRLNSEHEPSTSSSAVPKDKSLNTERSEPGIQEPSTAAPKKKRNSRRKQKQAPSLHKQLLESGIQEPLTVRKMKRDLGRSFTGLQLTEDNHCKLCKSNREPESLYLGHTLKDSEGRVICPILRALVCPICKATGDEAHTWKYCPDNHDVPEYFKPTLLENEAGEIETIVPRYRKVRNAVGYLRLLKY